MQQTSEADLGGHPIDFHRRHSFRRAAATGSLKASLPPADRPTVRSVAPMISSYDSPAAQPREQVADPAYGLSEAQHLALQEMRRIFAEVYSKEKVGIFDNPMLVGK